ncbi:hypothetical protein ACH5RR_040744 [Cinchona calisaya]|uniref:Uncharacterized protein n=1 Tax=Cinchona calisaya TaxID=153742 RepID=A0ABD2XSA1_9GENT
MATGTGPSPLIPFLMVATLGFLLHSQGLFEDISLVSDAQDSAFTLLLVLPIVVLLLVYQFTQSLVLPLAAILIIYAVTKMYLGPLVLIVVIHFLSVYLPSFEFLQGNNRYHDRDRDEYGWGCVLFFALFLALHAMFSEQFGQWGLVLIAVLVFLLYNFQSSPY